MAETYSLMCMNCRVTLSLGELYGWDKHGTPMPELTLKGMRCKATGEFHRGDAFVARVLERFLIAHRNHELRFVPIEAENFIAAIDEYIPFVDPEEVLEMELPIEEYDLEKELSEWEIRMRRPNADQE